MIDAQRLVDLLTAHIREHGTGPVQAYSPTGTAPHGTHDVADVELEHTEEHGWVCTLRLGGDEQ